MEIESCKRATGMGQGKAKKNRAVPSGAARLVKLLEFRDLRTQANHQRSKSRLPSSSPVADI